MEEKTKKELRLERKQKRKEKRKEFLKENIELVVQGGIAVLGLFGTVAGIFGIILDHKMAKEDIDYGRAVYYDRKNYVEYYLKEPLTNEEKITVVERQNNGESAFDILKDMGKL